MIRRALTTTLLLTGLGLSSAMAQTPGSFGVAQGEIRIADEESPLAASHGILPKVGRMDSFSWAGSSPSSLNALLKALNAPLAWESARQVAILTLSAPVLPDAESNVPDNWLLLRLQTLVNIGEYEAALALFKELNTQLLTEPLARIGSDLNWITRRTSAACRITAGVTEDEATDFESERSKLYWLTHYLLCQRLTGKTSEAEVSLNLLQETVPDDLPPILAPLVENWDTGVPLPRLSEKDALIYPALAALLVEPSENGQPLARRVPENFVTPEMADTLPPALQGALAQVERLDPLLRAHLAENAVRYHLFEPGLLARYYEEVAKRVKTPVHTSLQETYNRALLYSDALSARSPGNQATAVAEALRQYQRWFSARQARGILATTLRRLAEDHPALSIPLSFETIALYLDRGDRDEAVKITRALNFREGSLAELAATVSGRALQFAGASDQIATQDAAMPEFAQTPPADILWLITRYGQLMQSQGQKVRWPSRYPEFSAPSADIDYAPPARLADLHAARGGASPAEQLLRSVLVLNGTVPERTSDQAMLQVIAAWDALGLNPLSRALIAEALLGIPSAR